jgi:bifunctional UDP-N-acetylglucosamine pyrophosphorylase / glucosamine-1-phosphate N-acetyltransferase
MHHVPLACIILAAGIGSRMQSGLPKPLHPVAGKPMVMHAMDLARSLNPERIVAVIGPNMQAVADAVAPCAVVVQEERRGTGHAVAMALPALAGFAGAVVVLYADSPLMRKDTLEGLLAALRGPGNPSLAALAMRPPDPGRYGRMLLRSDGSLERIVEYLDASDDERAIDLCNAGFMAFDGKRLPALIAALAPNNAKAELYLTDTVAAANAAGWRCAVAHGPAEDALGVNARDELAVAEAIMQGRLRQAAMQAGATLLDPQTVYLCADTSLGRDVTVGQHVVFGPGVLVEDGVQIKPFSHLEGVRVRAGAIIGPFARLRPGTDVGEGAHIGNFVEAKNSIIGAGAKANHLAYLGDADIGAGSNIGAGTITCNYDGFEKHRTRIGANAFIGSNSTIVAPAAIGDGAYIGAGSVIVIPVAPDALALARAPQQEKPRWAARYRTAKLAKLAKDALSRKEEPS